MKALSGRQPWWWAILHAGKRIENRKWNTHYRGPILLHAAKGCTDQEMREALEWMTDVGVVPRSVWAEGPILDMPRGGIVGRARIVDVIPPWRAPLLEVATSTAIEKMYADRYPGVDPRWHMHEQYGFVLADVEPLPFVPCRGALGLFDLPEDIARTA